MIGTSRRSRVALTVSGATKPVAPRIKPMLAMLEPMTLPTAKSLLPASAACTLTSNSGMDVPMATIVKPIMSTETPKDSARLEAPRTSQLPPKNSATNPATKSATWSIIDQIPR